MRILKNRGDIYFSKVNKEKSKEQKILIIALVIIVVFTILFVTVLSVKNDFSAKKFFAPEENITVTQQEAEEKILPAVEGKTNFLNAVYSEENLLFVTLLQVDMDNVSYKVSVLKADTQFDGVSLSKIFSSSGIENVKKSVETQLGVSFDYYIGMELNSFINFYNELGNVSYPVLNDIRFKSSKSEVSYSLKIKAGEKNIDGKEYVSLIRYYLEEENNMSQANEIVLTALSQQINSKNLEKSEDLFKSFVTVANTNITIRDFSLSGDNMAVLSHDQVGVRVYNASGSYSKNKIDENDLQKIKSYFVK